MDAVSESVVVPDGNLADDKRALVLLLDVRAHQHVAAPVVVGSRIHQPALGKIGQHAERLLAENGDLGFEQLGKIVRQDARGNADRDPFGAQHQQQRNLRGKRDRLLLAPVIGRDELGQIVVEELVARKVGQAALDVARGSRRIAGEKVAEIALPLDEVLPVRQRDQRLSDRGVAVRVELHAVADDVGDLDEFAVVILMQ